MTEPLTIRELPEAERPRERLASQGAGALSDSELLAILLRTGIPGKNAVELARQLLAEHGSLANLSRCSVKEISAVKGIGLAKAVQLAAAFGLGARLARETMSKVRMDKAALIYDFMGAEMRSLRTESLRLVLLDARHRLMRVEEISAGSLNEVPAHPREILRPVLLYSAFAFILVHNHPSGDPTPSQSDNQLTRRMAEAANLMQITMIDHVIIGGDEADRAFFSYKDALIL